MAIEFVYGEDDRVAQWAAARIGVKFQKCTAIGVERNGELIAAVVYDRYSGNDLCMHVAAIPSARWATKDAMYRFFAYPFLQLGVTRVTGLVAADNAAARKFDEHIGFVFEGTMRRGMADGTDLIVYGMLRDECRWINHEPVPIHPES
jgi:RimJ/RimL family protein N-acetyltransferase